MKKIIGLIAEIMPQDGVEADEVDIDAVLEAHYQLVEISTHEHLPILLEAMKSSKNNFWTRELLSESVIKVGGLTVIDELFDAIAANTKEGHDNDMLGHLLSELAIADKAACRSKLEKILSDPNSIHHEWAKWLLDFCE